MIKDYIIIGAGLSGLNTARKIQQHNLGRLLVLDKSRGVGGRMATRRTLNTKFDHGAQFYRVKDDINELHHLWKEKEVSQQWFTSKSVDHWSSISGMTALPKAITGNLGILLEKKINSIHFVNNLWKIVSDKGEEWSCKNLIITSPLPQTVKLLENLENNSFLRNDVYQEVKNISYTKALVGLVTLVDNTVINQAGYQEFISGNIFSIADQKSKGLSEIPAYTITMSPDFSEKEFDQPEDEVITKILDSLKTYLPQVKIKEVELKKWRYCKPTSYCTKLFLEVAPKLFLIGDAFGGASLSGALRSSNALCQFLADSHAKGNI